MEIVTPKVEWQTFTVCPYCSAELKVERTDCHAKTVEVDLFMWTGNALGYICTCPECDHELLVGFRKTEKWMTTEDQIVKPADPQFYRVAILYEENRKVYPQTH